MYYSWAEGTYTFGNLKHWFNCYENDDIWLIWRNWLTRWKNIYAWCVDAKTAMKRKQSPYWRVGPRNCKPMYGLTPMCRKILTRAQLCRKTACRDKNDGLSRNEKKERAGTKFNTKSGKKIFKSGQRGKLRRWWEAWKRFEIEI